jgi:hypothetical protein
MNEISEAGKYREYTAEERLECALHAHAEQVFEIDDLRRQLADAKAREEKLREALTRIIESGRNDISIGCFMDGREM